MKNKVYHCFFEQSGTFKNEFKKLGYEAYDYDILNDFNETDYQIDLYSEINNAYKKKPSVFDNIKKEHEIIAFFPCVRFSHQIQLRFKGIQSQQKNWTLEQKLEECMILHKELNDLYLLISKLVIVCSKKKIPLIIENPYSTEHYLYKYWSIPSTIVDNDRSIRGDYFKKPTQYWFINREPSNNFFFEPQIINERKTINNISGNSKKGKTERSLISKEYANRFIREFII